MNVLPNICRALIIFNILLIAGCAIKYNNKSHHVYGEINDQYGNAVSEAKLRYSYSYSDTAFLVMPKWDPAIKTGYVLTDQEGRFDLGDLQLVHFNIVNVDKKGYKYIPQGHDLISDQPVIIKLWKKDAAPSKIIKRNISEKISADGRVSTINLINGKSNDIKLNLKIGITHIRQEPEMRDGDWTARIEIEDGGLLETSDLYQYLAPKDGYQKEWEWASFYGHPGSSFKLVKSFYFKLNTNKNIYGVMEVWIYAFESPSEASLIVRYSVNPDGKRDLYVE